MPLTTSFKTDKLFIQCSLEWFKITDLKKSYGPKKVKPTISKSKDKEAAAKTKAAAKAKAKATAVAPDVVDADRVVDRKEMSSFATSLKYKSTNPKDSNRTQAQALLSHYHQLTDDQKQSMVKKYQDMGGIKKLNWATEYLEKSENIKSSVQEWETGYYNVAEIFKLNGLEYFQVPEAERKQLLDAFLDESKKHVTPSEEQPAQEDHSVPLLVKYLYAFRPERVKENEVDTSSSRLAIQMDGIDQSKVEKALGNAAATSSVKLENPHLVALEDINKVAQSMKAKLDKELHLCLSLLKDLQAAKNPAVATPMKNLQDGLKQVEAWMDALRSAVHTALFMDASTDVTKVKDHTKTLEQYKSEGLVHRDGLGAVKQRIHSLLKEFTKASWLLWGVLAGPFLFSGNWPEGFDLRSWVSKRFYQNCLE